MAKCSNCNCDQTSGKTMRFLLSKHKLAILLVLLSGFGIGQALWRIEWDGEFTKSDTLFFNDNQLWSGTCVHNVGGTARGATLRVGRSANGFVCVVTAALQMPGDMHPAPTEMLGSLVTSVRYNQFAMCVV